MEHVAVPEQCSLLSPCMHPHIHPSINPSIHNWCLSCICFFVLAIGLFVSIIYIYMIYYDSICVIFNVKRELSPSHQLAAGSCAEMLCCLPLATQSIEIAQLGEFHLIVISCDCLNNLKPGCKEFVPIGVEILRLLSFSIMPLQPHRPESESYHSYHGSGLPILAAMDPWGKVCHLTA